MTINDHSNNYAFVASTLPISELNKNIKKWEINEIIIASEDLLASYKFLTDNYPYIRLTILPKLRFKQVIILLWKLLKLKLTSCRVYFFHECCWVVLDILISLIKPKGAYFPQVTMSGNPIKDTGCRFDKITYRIFTFYWFQRMFNIHRIINNNSICFSLKKYPKTITINNISPRVSLRKKIKEKKILFVIDSEFHDNNLMLALKKAIKLLLENGYQCEIKDHPRESERFNISNQFSEFSLIELDPNKPIELIPDEFLSVIGLYSTALIFFGDRSVSLLNFTEDADADAYFFRKRHLMNMPGGSSIHFIDNINEILDILKRDEKI
tara:strand:- start:1152 stop:2126 length:975 start_codon:yes stop_codon:yes gene_type:complete